MAFGSGLMALVLVARTPGWPLVPARCPALEAHPLGAWSRVRDPENVQLGPPFAAAEAGALLI